MPNVPRPKRSGYLGQFFRQCCLFFLIQMFLLLLLVCIQSDRPMSRPQHMKARFRWRHFLPYILNGQASLAFLPTALFPATARIYIVKGWWPELGIFGFFELSNNKKWFFIKLITYFCTSPIKKAHSQSNWLDKKGQKNHFFYYWKN